MNLETEKCVLVVDGGLPLGLIANTAAILGITLGKEWPETVGAPVLDRSGSRHLGIIQIPVPILKGTPEGLRELREKLAQPEFQAVSAADFSDLAQSCRTYEEWTARAAATPEEELRYVGLALWGPKKKVDRLTGSLPLLR